MTTPSSADYDETNTVLVQDREKSTKVELAHRARAAPLMALICLQSVCARAKRSLMLSAKTASRRAARARLKSPMSSLFEPPGLLTTMIPSLTRVLRLLLVLYGGREPTGAPG
jgi:hypothetical protein